MAGHSMIYCDSEWSVINERQMISADVVVNSERRSGINKQLGVYYWHKFCTWTSQTGTNEDMVHMITD